MEGKPKAIWVQRSSGLGFNRIQKANIPESKDVCQLIKEGKELIRKRQKLIRIADKSADGCKVVDEYVSDDLASGSDDEKRLKQAKEAASRKRRQTNQPRRYHDKKFKSSLSSSDQQLFRGALRECLLFISRFLLCYFVSFSSFGSARYQTISCCCEYLSGKSFTFVWTQWIRT